jgi:hypothetical protein
MSFKGQKKKKKRNLNLTVYETATFSVGKIYRIEKYGCNPE